MRGAGTEPPRGLRAALPWPRTLGPGGGSPWCATEFGPQMVVLHCPSFHDPPQRSHKATWVPEPTRPAPSSQSVA